ncbi:hypothetical protein ACG7TL_008361 [Trametes sanguinea]
MSLKALKGASNPSEPAPDKKHRPKKHQKCRDGPRPPSSSKENGEPVSKGGNESKRSVAVHWSKPEYHFVTDLLLTAIEERPDTCTALGFDMQLKDDSSPGNKTSGKMVHEHYVRLARAVFLESNRFSKFSEDNLEELAGVIKNRVIKLKSLYRDCRARLQNTGAGLVDEDRENELEPGSELANIWDAIQRDFPWYKRMNALMRGHPLVDRSGVANSATDIDLSILDRDREGTAASSAGSSLRVRHDLSWSFSESELDGNISDSVTDDQSSSDDEDAVKGESPDDPESQPGTKQKRRGPDIAAGAPAAKRRKGMLQHVQEIASADRQARILVTKMRLRARNEYKLKKHQMQRDIEIARLEHEARERDKQRDHELKLLAGQIELERLRLAASQSQVPSASPPSVPDWAIDPALCS